MASPAESGSGSAGSSRTPTVEFAGLPEGTLGLTALQVKPGGKKLAVLVRVVRAGLAPQAQVLAGHKQEDIQLRCSRVRRGRTQSAGDRGDKGGTTSVGSPSHVSTGLPAGRQPGRRVEAGWGQERMGR